MPHYSDEYSYGGDDHSISNPTASTRSSAMVAVDINDSKYRVYLGYRNIYIERAEPPIELMQRAREVIRLPREYPKMNDAAAQELIRIIKRLQTADEDAFNKGLVSNIVPDISQVFEDRLERGSNQLWHCGVAIPVLSNLLNAPSILLLPRPKPDFVFGYSRLAFSTCQTSSILHLVDGEFGHSYAIPDDNVCFPFLTIELKSQAKKGTHFAATNQAAGAGAIALNGQLELLRRSCGATGLDATEPRFFSVTIDQAYAQINVHWVGGGPVQGEPYSFHVKTIARHFLDNLEGVRAVSHALENILDYSIDVLLPSICGELDAYEAVMVTAKETSAAVGGGGDGL